MYNNGRIEIFIDKLNKTYRLVVTNWPEEEVRKAFPFVDELPRIMIYQGEDVVHGLNRGVVKYGHLTRYPDFYRDGLNNKYNTDEYEVKLHKGLSSDWQLENGIYKYYN